MLGPGVAGECRRALASSGKGFEARWGAEDLGMDGKGRGPKRGPGGRHDRRKPGGRPGRIPAARIGPIGLQPIGGMSDAFDLVHPRCVEETELDYAEGIELWRAGEPEEARDAL